MAQQPSTIDPDYPPFVWGMIPLRPVKHELFAQKVAGGMTATAAYQQVYGESNEPTASANASRLLSTDKVRDRVDYILGKAAEHVEMTKGEALAICADICRNEGEETKDRIRAIAEISKCKGWYAPEKFDGNLSVGTPEEISAAVEARALDLHGKREKVERVLGNG